MDEQKLTPAQALRILEAASGAYKGTRQEHVNIQKAVATLNELVNPKTDSKPKKDKKAKGAKDQKSAK